MEVDTPNVALVSGERPYQPGRLEVPDFDGARTGAGADELLGVAKPNTLHRGGVAAQALKRQTARSADGRWQQ